MLDLRFVRTHPDLVRQGFAKRRQEASVLDALLAADERRRRILMEIESLRNVRNRLAHGGPPQQGLRIPRQEGDDERLKIIVDLIRAQSGSDQETATRLIRFLSAVGLPVPEEGELPSDLEIDVRLQLKALAATAPALGKSLREVEAETERLALLIPNLPDESVPEGDTEEENVIVREWGEPRQFDFAPKGHWEIAVDLGIVDFEQATKIAGANFEVFRGPGARLRRALINFMLDVHTKEEGYLEVSPPLLARRDSLIASGHLPKFEDDQFHVVENDLFLIPTSESALANLHRDEILEAAQLPLKYVAYTPCFRYEKFSAGKESRGLIRQFQFDKVEMFKFVLPETAMEELEGLVANAETIYQRLGLPYKLALLCAGEMSMAAVKGYDPMAWFPGAGKWMELSSCSNCGDWQARRAGVRFRRERGGKPEYVHTLNGSGLAVGRTFACILENYQNADGSVTVPEVLVPYMEGIEKIGGE